MYNNSRKPRDGGTNKSSFSDYFGGGRGGSQGGSRRSGGGFSGGGNRGGGSRGGRGVRKINHLNQSLFVRKAEPVTLEQYQAQHTFKDFPLEDWLKETITKCGFTSPTAIQDQAIGYILEGRDLIGLANTGTGKTGAFLIPLIDKVLKLRKQKKDTVCLIIAPTRELAQQIEEELIRMTTREMNIFSTCCVGGADIRRQIMRLKKFNQFIIGTPGRLVDLVNRGILKLDRCQNIVLDEVDRMLDMGFIDDIQFLVGKMPKERQSLFFSATMDKKLEPLMNTFLTNPVTVSVKTAGASMNIEQDIVRVSRHDKFEKLCELLNQEHFSKVLIFTRTKAETERLYEQLEDRGFSVESIHGDKTLGFRRRALDKFKNDHVNILVATDVAARGLDVKDISHVINYDAPESQEDYVHRIGRTGRAGKVGYALTFVEA